MGLFTTVKPAKRISRALEYFNPNYPVGETLSVFHVDRGTQSPVDEIRDHLLTESEYPKLILAGPRGSGKSMELMKIQQDRKINREFFVKVMPIKSSAVLLITFMLKELCDIAGDNSIPFTRDMKDARDFLHFRFGWNLEVEVTAPPKHEIFDEEWMDHSKSDDRRVRLMKKRMLDVDPPTIINWINKFSDQIEKRKRKSVLIIVKDLDKLNREIALEMFNKNFPLLTMPKCLVIYTFPGVLYFDSNFDRIRRNFSDFYYLRNLNPWITESYRFCWHYKKLREMVTKRIHPNLFDFTRGDIIDEFIRFSGGVPLELMGLLRQAVLIASRLQRPWVELLKWCFRYIIYPLEREFLGRRIKNVFFRRITPDVLSRVLGRRRDYYKNSLSPKQIDSLKSIAENPGLLDLKNEAHSDLLERDLIIQYGPENQFSFRINPFVLEYIKAQT